MYKFSYRKNGEVIEKEFDTYFKLVMFVAANRVKDDDFISMTLGDTVINGLDELATTAYEKASEAQYEYDLEMGRIMTMMAEEGFDDDEAAIIGDDEDEIIE